MKPTVRFALQYPSGAGGMFLTELVDNTSWEDSGCWDTNPGCRRNMHFNEYGGSVHCVQVDDSTEALPTTNHSILIAKQQIEKYLPFYDCPTTYVIDATDDDSFDYTLELMFIKKWCAWMPLHENQREIIDQSGVNEFVEGYKSIDLYSKIVLQYVNHHLGKTPFEDFVAGARNAWIDDGRSKQPPEVWSRNQYRNLSIDPEEIEKYSELHVINYADLFLYGLPTDSIFDKYKSEIQDYRNRNDKILDTFNLEFHINN